MIREKGLGERLSVNSTSDLAAPRGVLPLEIDSLVKHFGPVIAVDGISPVSYTHLDVYKRQFETRVRIDFRTLAGK